MPKLKINNIQHQKLSESAKFNSFSKVQTNILELGKLLHHNEELLEIFLDEESIRPDPNDIDTKAYLIFHCLHRTHQQWLASLQTRPCFLY